VKVHKLFALFPLGLAIAAVLVSCENSVKSGSPNITINPTSGGPDTSVAVTGAGFPAKTTVKVRLGPPSVGATPQSYGTAMTDAKGEFTLTFAMPARWPDGTLIAEQELMVVVLNENGSVKATAPFSFRPATAESAAAG
jgi:hypothetical protein